MNHSIPARLGSLIIAAVLFSNSTVRAQPAVSALQNLKQFISSLGYKLQEERPTEFSFNDGRHTAWMQLSDNNEYVYLTIGYDVAKDAMGKIPSMSLLEWNDTHENYFSVHRNRDGSGIVNIYNKMILRTIDAASINQAITGLRSDVDQNLELIDSSRWK